MLPILFILYYFPKWFIITYIVLNYALSILIYFKACSNYFPHMKLNAAEIKKFEEEHPGDKKKQYFHDEFPSFSRVESASISFFWIYYGILNYFWIKATLAVGTIILLWLRMKIYFFGRSIKSEFSIEDRQNLLKIARFYVKAVYVVLGVWVTEKDLTHDNEVLKVYKKYLGQDYNPDLFKDKYSTIIANHVSWADILYVLSKYGPSFISKDSVNRIPFIGYVSYAFKTLYINRQSKDSRVEVMNQISKRQQEIVEGKSYFPLTIYPEGTTENGRNIITFKKGAFYTLTPLKINILKVDNRVGKFPLAAGGMKILLHIALSVTFLKNDFEALELPVFAPNEYLFENFKNLGKDKPEILAEACRRVMSEIGNLPLTDGTFENKLKYMSAIERKTVKNT
jgi:1-acyl-sn-glycerol-3-phosphate acyltransferase